MTGKSATNVAGDCRLQIIIVNWNSGSQLSDVLFSIIRFHHGLVSAVVIVDNASNDDSLNSIELLNDLPFQLKIIRNKENEGFSVACNQGAAQSDSEFILFLNPDTRLFESSLSIPIAYLEDPINKGVGVAGIQLIDDQSRIARSCARFPTLGIFLANTLGLNRLHSFNDLNIHMTDWAHDETRVVDHVIGAYYLIRRTLFNTLSGFDERFFMYLEDLDLSLRLHQAGYRSVYLANSQAFHAGGGTSRQVKANRLFYSLRSRLIYGFKHFSPIKAWCLLFITLSLEPCSRVVLALMKGSWGDTLHTLQAYLLLIKDLPRVLIFSRR